jgi:hypothetical protein
VLRQVLDWFKLQQIGEPVGSSGGVAAGALEGCRQLGRALAEAAARK